MNCWQPTGLLLFETEIIFGGLPQPIFSLDVDNDWTGKNLCVSEKNWGKWRVFNNRNFLTAEQI